MPRDVQFVDDDQEDGPSDRNESDDSIPEGAQEVDLSVAEKDDKSTAEDSLFDDLGPRGLLKPDKAKAEDEDEDEDEADEQEETGDDEEDDEDEGPRNQRNFRKRLLRSERQKDELREENEALAERLVAVETRLTKRETVEQLAAKRATAETKLSRIRTELATAKEAGNTADEIRLTEELSDVKAEIRVAERDAQTATETNAAAAPVQRQPRLARQWLRRHPRFDRDAAFKAAVQTIDRDVAKRFNADDSAYWEELDKQVKKLFPDEYKGQRNEPPVRRRQHPAAGGERDDSQGRGVPRRTPGGFHRRGNKVLLTPGHRSTMRKFGMDPDSKEDQRAFIKNNL